MNSNLKFYYQILCGSLGGLDDDEERRAVAGLLRRAAKKLGYE
jgi:hypothetical protein